MIKSTWKISLGGVVLLDYGESILAEPEMPMAAETQETRYVGGAWAKVRPRGGLLRSYSWSRVIALTSPAEVQTMQMQLPRLFLGLAATDLLIEVAGGGSSKVADFALSSCRSAMRSRLVPTELLLEFAGAGGEETVLTTGGFGDVWAADDGATWAADDATKWKII